MGLRLQVDFALPGGRINECAAIHPALNTSGGANKSVACAALQNFDAIAPMHITRTLAHLCERIPQSDGLVGNVSLGENVRA